MPRYIQFSAFGSSKVGANCVQWDDTSKGTSLASLFLLIPVSLFCLWSLWCVSNMHALDKMNMAMLGHGGVLEDIPKGLNSFHTFWVCSRVIFLAALLSVSYSSPHWEATHLHIFFSECKVVLDHCEESLAISSVKSLEHSVCWSRTPRIPPSISVLRFKYSLHFIRCCAPAFAIKWQSQDQIGKQQQVIGLRVFKWDTILSPHWRNIMFNRKRTIE